MRGHKYLAIAALSAILAAAGACGPKADRTVEVAMTDNVFTPNALKVTAGETVVFKFTNNGAVTHDAFVGNLASQQEHLQNINQDDGSHAHHTGAVTLEPGSKGELSYTFAEAGEILIGCHQPGHFDGGMKATVSVT